jgi:hypothetical protein
VTILEAAMIEYLQAVYPDRNVRVGPPLGLGSRADDEWSIECSGNESLDDVCQALASFWRRAAPNTREG